MSSLDPHWKDWAIAQYLYEMGKPPDGMKWTQAHDAFQRVIERAKAAEEQERAHTKVSA